jgi:hypothetical protein
MKFGTWKGFDDLLELIGHERNHIPNGDAQGCDDEDNHQSDNECAAKSAVFKTLNRRIEKPRENQCKQKGANHDS